MNRLMQRHPNLLLKAIQLVVLGALSGTLLFAPACGSGHSPANPASSPVMLLSISVNPSTGAIPLGGMLQLSAIGTFSDKSAKDISNSVVWASSAPTVAAVTPSGQVNGEAQGGATVTAAQGSVSGSASVSILPAMLVSLTVSADNPSIPVGQSTQVRARGTFTDNSSRDATTLVTWFSSPTSVATINSAGLATGVAVGSTTIKATSGSINGSTGLTVTAVPNFTISASPASFSVVQGNQGTSTITTTLSGGFNSAISLSASGMPSGTTVSFKPNPIPAPGSGNSTMTITVGSSTPVGTYPVTVTGNGGGIQQTATVTLTISAVPNFMISASPASLSVVQGTQGTSTLTTTISGGFNSAISLSASGMPSGTTVTFNPNPIPAPGSGDSTLTITVGSSTPVGTYPLTVTGNGGGIQQNTTVTLTVTAPVLVSIAVTPVNPSIAVGKQQPFTATGSYTDGTKSDLTSSVTWNSDNPQVATVNNAGVAVAVNVGTANISASYQGQNAGTTLTVQPAQQPPDTTLRISYPDASTIDLCAMIYVFDPDQQLAECCGCVVSADGLRTLSWQNDLMGNPLTGVKSKPGVVNIVAADHASNPTCDASVISPSGSLVYWFTHLAPAGNGSYSVQERSATSSPPTAAQISALQAQCYFVEVLGSGQGICTCGVGN